MSKQKTALQQAQIAIVELMNSTKDENQKTAYYAACLELESLLPTERQQIEQAFKDGGEDELRGEFGGRPQYRNAAQYYELTYNEQK